MIIQRAGREYYSCGNNHSRRAVATVFMIILPKTRLIPTTPTDRDNREFQGHYWPFRRWSLTQTCKLVQWKRWNGIFLRTTTTCPAVFTIRPMLWPRRRKFHVIAVVTSLSFYERTAPRIDGSLVQDVPRLPESRIRPWVVKSDSSTRSPWQRLDTPFGAESRWLWKTTLVRS